MSPVPTLHTTEPLPAPPSHSGDPGLVSAQLIVHVWRNGPTVVAVTSGLPNRMSAIQTLDLALPGGAVEVHVAAQEVSSVEAMHGPAPVLTLGGDI
jgi:hypothetical protein